MLKSRSLKNQYGQGAVEYILLLVIAVAIVMGLAAQFYQPFGNYVKNYVGEYLQCLIETGELPAMGTENASGECSEVLAANSFAKNRQNSGAGKNTGGSNSDGDSDSDKNKNSKKGDGSDGSGGSGSGGRSGTKSGGLFLGPKQNGAVSEQASQDSKKKEIPYTGSDKVSSRRPSVSTMRAASRQIRTIALSGYTVTQLKKNDREQSRYRNIAAAEVLEEGRGPKKLKKPRTESQKTVENESGFELGVGSLFRIGIILMIIIALVVLLGGQALQISKNWE